MKKFKLTATLFLSLLLVACATKPIDHEALKRDKISSITLESETALSFEPSTAGADGAAVSGGGILGALVGSGIDASANAKRKKHFAPIGESIGKHDLRSLFSEHLNKLKGEVFSDALNVQVTDKLPKTKDMKVNSLNLTANYHLSANHESVIVKVNSLLKTNQEGGNFYHLFSETSDVDLGGVKVTRDDVTQFWLDNPEELMNTIKAAIQKAAVSIEEYYNTDQTKK